MDHNKSRQRLNKTEQSETKKERNGAKRNETEQNGTKFSKMRLAVKVHIWPIADATI